MYHLSSAWYKYKENDNFISHCERVAINGDSAIYDLKEEYCTIEEDTILEEDEQEVFAFVYPINYHLIKVRDTPVFYKTGSNYITIPIEVYEEYRQKTSRYNWIKRLFKKGVQLTKEDFDL